MRQKFNLNLSGGELGPAMILLHGGYAAGKTHFGADFLKYESKYGQVRFLNVIGEDGYLSASSFGLGEIGETVETYDDMMAALTDYKKAKVRALVVDSMKAASRLTMAHVIGDSGRMPEVGGNKNEWGAVHFAMEGLTNYMRAASYRTMCLCPSDKSVNQLDGKTYITPDLPGREAAGSAGWFDFVGYVSAEVTGAGGTISRKIKIVPNNLVLTRQRLPFPIKEDISIPEGGGGWERLLAAINKGLGAGSLPANAAGAST